MRAATGWQFLDDPGGRAAGGPALTLSGGIAMVGGPARVRQALMLLLATVPGERVMRPGYGCPLDRLMFAPNDDTTAGLAIHYVRQSVQRWLPEVEIIRLDAGRDPSGPPERLWIWLDYRIRAAQLDDRLALSLNLDGEPPDAVAQTGATDRGHRTGATEPGGPR